MNARKKRAIVVWIVIALVGSGLSLSIIDDLPNGNDVSRVSVSGAVPPVSVCSAACALVTEPDDGIAPLLALIRDSTSSIDLVMYELEDPGVVTALIGAQQRGVAVRVILNRTFPSQGAGFGGANPNGNAYTALAESGVAVRWAPARFAFTHEKAMVVDGSRGFIMSFNLVPHYYPTGRDFGIVDDDTSDVAAMETVFDADWEDESIITSAGDDLVWSPGSRDAIVRLIESATSSLEIYNEEMADARVIAALETAARRGVDVEVVMTTSPDWKSAFRELTAAGVRVYTYSSSANVRYIHAKVIVADDVQAFIGSENFSVTSLDRNRELGVVVADRTVIASLERTFAADRAGATPFK